MSGTWSTQPKLPSAPPATVRPPVVVPHDTMEALGARVHSVSDGAMWSIGGGWGWGMCNQDHWDGKV